MEGNITLKIFDFDGTLFNSPNPNPALWDRETIGKLKGELERGGYGWYQNPITLNDKYIDEDKFVDYVVAEVEKSMREPNSITVLLTGRATKHEPQIRKILYQKGLEFDEYGFKTGGTTMEFKEGFIRNLINKYKATRVVLWDDRGKYVPRFEKFLAEEIKVSPTLKDYKVNYVKTDDYHIDEKRERELVNELMKNPEIGKHSPKKFQEQEREKKRHERKPTFWEAYLYPESHGRLVQAFGDKIPSDWKIYAHHMTIAFGRPKNDNTKEYVQNNLGKEVELTAVKLGISDTAMAIEVQSEAPSDNKIKHVTLAVSPTGKPVQSNQITNWEVLSEPIKLKAKISAQY